MSIDMRSRKVMILDASCIYKSLHSTHMPRVAAGAYTCVAATGRRSAASLQHHLSSLVSERSAHTHVIVLKMKILKGRRMCV